MYCPHCGSRQNDSAAYCSECGTRLSTKPVPAVPPVPKVNPVPNVPPAPVPPYGVVGSPTLVEKALLGVDVVVCAFLALSFLLVLIDQTEGVVDRISLYSNSASMMGAAFFAFFSIAVIALPVSIAEAAGQICLTAGQPAQKAWGRLKGDTVATILSFILIFLMSEFVFDDPSFSSRDIGGPLYFVFGLLGSWMEDQMLMIVLVCGLSIAAVVLHESSSGAVPGAPQRRF